MIARRTKLQLLVFFVIAVVGMAYTGAKYAGLATLVPGHDNGYVISADFTDSGGVFKGAEVTERGITVGKVESLSLIPGGVRASLRLEPGTKVQTPVKAQVANRSAVGEQYIDIEPQSEDGALMKAGGRITDTTIPIQPTQLVVNLDNLATGINTADVTTVLDELGKAFNGSGDDLQRLITAGDQLTATATANLPQTIALIRNSEPVLDTQRDVAGDFKSYSASLASLTQQLKTSDPDFRTLFQTGTASATQIDALLNDTKAQLPVLLRNLVSTAQVQAVRIPALRQILVTYPNVVAGGFTVTPGDGTAHFGFATTMTPAPCTNGYQATKKRDPSDTSVKSPNANAYCSDTTGPDSIRGANNAPRPNGLKAFPNDKNAANTPTPTSNDAASADSTAIDQSLLSATAPSAGTGLADYDPTSGHVIAADGTRYQLGSTASAAVLFGSQSWEWMMLDPLASK